MPTIAGVGLRGSRVASAALTKPYRYAWMASHAGAYSGLFDRVAKLDVATGAVRVIDPGPGCYPSEPVFVQRPHATAEDDGWALALVYDAAAERSHVAVIDGATVFCGLASS